MDHIKWTLVLVAALAFLWSSCKSEDNIKKKISIRNFCCINHNLMCKERKSDQKELLVCIHAELETLQYVGDTTFCEKFQTFCQSEATMLQPVPPRETSTMHTTSVTDYAGQWSSNRNKDHDCEDPTYGVSVPLVVLIAILMFLLGIVGMLIFTCFTHELWQRWKICRPFHSCLSRNTYVETAPNTSDNAVIVANNNRTMYNPTYHDPAKANRSMEHCIYDTPRDSIQADNIHNAESSVGTHKNPSSILQKYNGNKDDAYTNPSQYEQLNESEHHEDQEHRYSCIQSVPYNLNSSELTSESSSASTHNREYQKVEGNHEYFEVEPHSKITTCGS